MVAAGLSESEIARYVEVKPLAQGGFASVFEALDPRLERRVALKVFDPMSSSVPTDSIVREAKITARLGHHPNIVTIYDVDTTSDGRVYISMELLPRGSLSDELATNGPLDVVEVLRIAPPLVDALEAAHAAGVLHGDVKPSNVLLSAFGQPVLADFGLAALFADSSRSTVGRALTPAYAPPEAFTGAEMAASRDVYSLGATLCSLLTGSAPFDDPNGGSLATYRRVLDEQPSLPDHIDTELADLVVAMLAKDPAARPTLADVASRLRAMRASRGLPELIDLRDHPPEVWPSPSSSPPPSVPPPPSVTVTAGDSTAAPQRESVAPVSEVGSPVTAARPAASPALRPPVASPPPQMGAPGAAASRTVQAERVASGGRRARGTELGTHALTDRPTRVDLLGMEPLVIGLARLLDDDRTQLPLTVGIMGAWGSGKSSTMVQLDEVLSGAVDGRRWIGVHIGLWRTRGADRLWSLLAREIHAQVDRRIGGLGKRLAFRTAVAIERRGIAGTAIAVVVAALGIALVGTAAVGAAQGDAVSSVLVGLTGTAAIVISASGSYAGFVGGPVFRRIRHRRADYDEQLGLPALADRDIDAVFTVCKRKNLSIAVFLDDLDRCLPSQLAETLAVVGEATSGRHDWPGAFVIGLDRDIVVASVEAQYADTLAALAGRSADYGHDFGGSYLEKILQLDVRLDRSRQRVAALVDPGLTAQPYARQEARIRHYVEILESAALVDPGDVFEERNRRIEASMLLDTTSINALHEAMRRERARVLSRGAPSVHEAESAVLDVVRVSPRQAKRFDNALRLQLHVANGTAGCQLTFAAEEILALAKWVALSLLWPRLAAVMDRELGLLAELETLASDRRRSDAMRKRLATAPLDGIVDVADARRLADLFELGGAAARISTLPIDSFVRSV